MESNIESIYKVTFSPYLFSSGNGFYKQVNNKTQVDLEHGSSLLNNSR